VLVATGAAGGQRDRGAPLAPVIRACSAPDQLAPPCFGWAG
jgi:hypothetical protein